VVFILKDSYYNVLSDFILIMKLLLLLITIAFILIIHDMTYLSYISNDFKAMIHRIQRCHKMELDIGAAVMCYIVIILALWYFIIRERRSLWDAALFGAVVYAVYELTNKATLKEWDWSIVAIDTIWGSILFTSTAWIIYLLQDYNIL